LVTWYQAAAYCAFRHARLPTEAEFERAARGTSRRKYPWGNLYNSHASNHGRLGVSSEDPSDGYAELAPVGSYPSGSTPEGFLDLAGNVSEWVLDNFALEYPAGRLVDPRGPAAGSYKTSVRAKVLRGGNYKSIAPGLRGAARGLAEPNTADPRYGFRCARSASPR